MISKVNFFSMSWIVFQLFSLQAQSYCASCPKPQAHDELKAYHGFTLSFNSKTKLAAWVYYELVPDYINGPKVKRASKFLFDSGLKGGTARNTDYKKSGFDKGHLAPAADMAWSAESMHDCFYFSNIVPQRPECNRGIWKQLEENVRKIAKKTDTVKVFSGPVFEGPKNKPVVYQFTQDGHYLLITQWYNKCLGQDTFFFTRLSIELCTTTGVKTIVKGEPKLIKIYDMMGRPVQHIRKEEVLIYLYDDGSTKKVLIH